MGLPSIEIDLTKKAESIITRSARGVVCLILDDSTSGGVTSAIYQTEADIDTTQWSSTNVGYIKLAMLGGPASVICVRKGTLSTTLTSLLQFRFNYLAMPGASTTDTTAIVNWVKTQRTNKKTYKAVVANSTADSVAVINFTTTGIVVGETTYTAVEYTARIAGILAGIALNRSATYYVIDEIEAATLSSDPDADINAGKLIIINDGEKFKIGRAVNSLTTTTSTYTNDMKSIKIMEGIDLICDDIRNTFNDNYVGKVINSYANRQLFCTSVNEYFSTLVNEGVLYDAFDSYVEVDVSAQRSYAITQGVDVSDYTNEDLKAINTGTKVFLTGQIQLQNAMEDLKVDIAM